jgi:hypothetical protein
MEAQKNLKPIRFIIFIFSMCAYAYRAQMHMTFSVSSLPVYHAGEPPVRLK